MIKIDVPDIGKESFVQTPASDCNETKDELI